jgi:regulator of sigma E protease
MPNPPLWLVLLAFLCAIGPLVFFHELGHYLIARLFGIPAETFSIGFGRELVGWTDSQRTRWKVGWLPLGGYVKFVGDMSPASEPAELDAIPADLRDRAFQLRPVWQRFLVVLAGPAANFLLAILIFASVFMVLGSPSTNVVGKIKADGAAAAAGLQPKDRIMSVAGKKVEDFGDLQAIVFDRPDQKVEVLYQRGSELRQVTVVLHSEVDADPFGHKVKRGVLGVSPAPASPLHAIADGTRTTWVITRSIVVGIGEMVRGRVSGGEVAGPIRIAQIAGQGASLGLLPFVQLVALLSINLGFINLLPVPMLDGGHLFFYGVEAVRRRPLSARALEWAFRGGLALILALVLFTTVNDLGSLGLWDRLQRLIG